METPKENDQKDQRHDHETHIEEKEYVKPNETQEELDNQAIFYECDENYESF